MLYLEGRVINPKRTYRLYREEGLQVRTKRRKKLQRPRVPTLLPTSVNERWSVDFVSDQLANGRRFRVLNIIDDFTRESSELVRQSGRCSGENRCVAHPL